MKLDPHELPEHIKKLNPHLFMGAVEVPVSQPDPERALDGAAPKQKGRPCGVVVSLIRLGRRHLDDDNLAGGFKPLRDAIAASLAVDDASPFVTWQYGQVLTKAEQGVVVILETI